MWSGFVNKTQGERLWSACPAVLDGEQDVVASGGQEEG